MSYVVLARKWRPQSFTDLVGQEHVARTLRNSIALDRVAHAFLFTGVRGVGKTTSARILAKALNCVNGPTVEPCLVCPACTEIAQGVDLDVLEIDGATYTSVNDIRDLQESMPYRPNRDRFKIYIVDEVHMLSSSAWNAFLKTLEEPPPHVKFIFATTEVQKVPVTILSRCQRYDFKLIGAGVIASRIRHVLDAEGIAAEDGALQVIAREAQGSMRDAMSLLDQVIAWAGESGKLTTDGVCRVLGVADRSSLSRLAHAVLKGDAGACLGVVKDLAEQGYDMVHLARDFATHLRDMVVVKVSRDARSLVDVAESELAELTELVKDAAVEDVTRIHQGLSAQLDDLSRSPLPRAALEMILVRLSLRPVLEPVDGLLRKLADLEARLGAGGGAQSGGSHGGGAQGGAAPTGGSPGGAPLGGRGPARADGARADAAIDGRAPLEAVPAEPPSMRLPTAPRPGQTPVRQASDAIAQAAGLAPTAGVGGPALFTPPPFPGARPPQPESPRPPPGAPPPSAVFQPPAFTPPAFTPPAFTPPAVTPPPARDHDEPPPSDDDAELHRRLMEETEPAGFDDAIYGPPSAPPPSAPPGDPFRVDRPSAPPPSAPTSPQQEVTRERWAPMSVSADERAALLGILPLVEAAREKSAILASILERVALVANDEGDLRLGTTERSFEGGQLADTKLKQFLDELSRDHLGGEKRIVLEQIRERRPTLADLYGHARRERRAKLDEDVLSHPLVVAARGVLGAEIKEISVPQEIESQHISLA